MFPLAPSRPHAPQVYPLSGALVPRWPQESLGEGGSDLSRHQVSVTGCVAVSLLSLWCPAGVHRAHAGQWQWPRPHEWGRADPWCTARTSPARALRQTAALRCAGPGLWGRPSSGALCTGTATLAPDAPAPVAQGHCAASLHDAGVQRPQVIPSPPRHRNLLLTPSTTGRHPEQRGI